LIEWLVTRVVVFNHQVEIRYVIPTGPATQTSSRCHLRSNYREPVPSTQGLCPHRPAAHKTCRGWIGFAHFATTMVGLCIAEFGDKP
jgi:hypothetical protein